MPAQTITWEDRTNAGTPSGATTEVDESVMNMIKNAINDHAALIDALVAASGASTDANNVLTVGSDGKLYLAETAIPYATKEEYRSGVGDGGNPKILRADVVSSSLRYVAATLNAGIIRFPAGHTDVRRTPSGTDEQITTVSFGDIPLGNPLLLHFIVDGVSNIIWGTGIRLAGNIPGDLTTPANAVHKFLLRRHADVAGMNEILEVEYKSYTGAPS